MAAVNSVKIAQRLGKILAVDDFDNSGLICQPFLRFRVALDTSKPLIPGFHLPRPGKEPLWISFRYERLGDYCTLCGVIGHKKNQCPQPPNRISPEKYKIPLQTFSLYGIRQTLSSSMEDTDSGISSVGTSQSHSDAQSSPAHGAESALHLGPRQHVAHPSLHVVSSPRSQAMQLASSTGIRPMVSYPAGNFLDTAFVASPYPFPILPFDNCSPLGANPLSALGMQITSATSLNATLPLGSPHFSKVDKGKSPMEFVSSEPLPLADSFLPLALMNISHPCPIIISPPLSHPAHFTDFLAKWPQPTSPRPIIQPSSHLISSDLDHSPFSSSVGPCRTTSTVTHLPYNSPPDHSLCSFGNSPMQSLGFGSSLTSVRPLVPSPVLFHPASSTLIDSPPLKLTGSSHRLSRFHPYVKPTSLSSPKHLLCLPVQLLLQHTPLSQFPWHWGTSHPPPKSANGLR
jgi:hypothetical protein